MPSPAQFIYTGYLAISHILIQTEAPDVSLFGLYGSMVQHNLIDFTLYCNFTQLNDLLACEECGAEEIIMQLSEIVASGTQGTYTIDATAREE